MLKAFDLLYDQCGTVSGLTVRFGNDDAVLHDEKLGEFLRTKLNRLRFGDSRRTEIGHWGSAEVVVDLVGSFIDPELAVGFIPEGSDGTPVFLEIKRSWLRDKELPEIENRLNQFLAAASEQAGKSRQKAAEYRESAAAFSAKMVEGGTEFPGAAELDAVQSRLDQLHELFAAEAAESEQAPQLRVEAEKTQMDVDGSGDVIEKEDTRPQESEADLIERAYQHVPFDPAACELARREKIEARRQAQVIDIASRRNDKPHQLGLAIKRLRHRLPLAISLQSQKETKRRCLAMPPMRLRRSH